MHERFMNTGDFYALACFNRLSYFLCLDQISALNRHQRHQEPWIARIIPGTLAWGSATQIVLVIAKVFRLEFRRSGPRSIRF